MSENNSFNPFVIRCGGRLLSYDRPAVMGILNCTPDSFYDGGRYLTDAQIVGRAAQIINEGADIIDIGVVSTRPGAELIPVEIEAERLSSVVRLIRNYWHDVVISVDTCFAHCARMAVENGADIVNDISGGLFDDKMFDTVAQLGVPYVLMHNRAKPSIMSDVTEYDDLFQHVVNFLSERINRLHQLGVADIIIDPGFGFSKTLDQNYELMSRLGDLHLLFPRQPLLVALSRKSMIYKLLDTTPDNALEGTVALHAAALLDGAQMLRVHDVRAAVQTVTIVQKLMNASKQHSL